MVICKGSDLTLKINLNVVPTKIRVFTTKLDNYIEKTDIVDGKVKLLASELQKLNSGVIAFTYFYNDGVDDKEGIKYTDYYLLDKDESGIIHKDATTIQDYLDELVEAKLSGKDFTELIEKGVENSDKIKKLSATVDDNFIKSSFTVENTDTINLVKKINDDGSSWIEANVIVDPDENNLLKVKENGLYVDGIEVDQDWDLGTY